MMIMAYEVKTLLPCDRCGVPTNRRLRGKRGPQCFECSLKAMVAYGRDLAERNGDGYDAWKQSMRDYAAKLGLSADD